MIHAYHESICLGLQFKVGGKFHLRLNIGASLIVHKYHEGKMPGRSSTRVLAAGT